MSNFLSVAAVLVAAFFALALCETVYQLAPEWLPVLTGTWGLTPGLWSPLGFVACWGIWETFDRLGWE